ncbi:MAG: CbtA family protein [Paracoccaceae bacterium]
MVGPLLLRGMLVGIVAGLIAMVFAYAFGEPQVDRAITFEGQMEHITAGAPAVKVAVQPAHDHEIELVSRETQSTFGLATGLLVYGAAVGGIFALVFAFVYGRVGTLGARATSALLALGAFVAVVLVPQIKYPANPPAVGSGDTIGVRTALFFVMLVVSIATMVAAVILAKRMWAQYGGWTATIIAGVAFVVVIGIVQLQLPPINEIPEGFSADVIWRFRISSIGIHLILWVVIGLTFGALAERQVGERHHRRFAHS